MYYILIYASSEACKCLQTNSQTCRHRPYSPAQKLDRINRKILAHRTLIYYTNLKPQSIVLTAANY